MPEQRRCLICRGVYSSRITVSRSSGVQTESETLTEYGRAFKASGAPRAEVEPLSSDCVDDAASEQSAKHSVTESAESACSDQSVSAGSISGSPRLYNF